VLKVRLDSWASTTCLNRFCLRKGVRLEFPDYRDDVVKLLVTRLGC
jgi:hypothetical protein